MMSPDFAKKPDISPARETNKLPVRRLASAGFSLVEVVLSIGVVAFAMVALLGLLAVSTNSSRSSDEDTSVAAVAREVMTQMRSVPYSTLLTKTATWPIDQTTTDVWPVEPGDPTTPAPPPTYLATLYFDNDAHRVATVGAAIYKCEVKLRADPAYNSTDGTTNLYRVRLAISPAQGSSSARPQVIRTSVSRND